MTKELTERGLEDVDEIIDKRTEPEPPKKLADYQIPDNTQPLPPPERKAYIQKCNDDPKFQDNDIKAVPAGIYYTLIAGFILFVILFGVAVVWGNISFSGKNFAPFVNISVEPAQVSVPVNIEINSTNNIEVQGGNYTLNLPKELSDALIKVLNTTNNST